MTAFADHFSGHAGRYAQFRPSYPPEFIAHVAAQAPARDLAWDCGTGNGQAAVLLATHFERVWATDASVEQIAHAAAHPRVTYHAARERASGLSGGSAALVTVAQAYHWFDHAAFGTEVQRVLQPAGVLAVWCYQLLRITPDIDAVLDEFYTRRIGAYWPPERRTVENGYRDLPFPLPEFDAGEWSMHADLTLDAFLGYVGTWSAVAKARAAEARDPVGELRAAITAPWGDPDHTHRVTWPLSVRAGRKPDVG